MARTIALSLLLVLTAPTAAAQTTRLIPYSATLPADAAAATASVRAVTFALFDEAEGGTLLWSEAQTVAVDARGRYSAHLGAQTPLPLQIFRTEQARWLEVTVDGKALPRVMLVAVPYALRAADAETLGGTPASGFVRTDGSGRRRRADGTPIDETIVDGTGVPNQIAKWSTPTALSSSIVTESFDNRIGILAPDPTGGGVVDSRLTIRHFDNNTALAVLNTLNQRRFALNTNFGGGWILFDGGGGTWNAGLRQAGGRLGIGQGVLVGTKLWVVGGTDAGIVVSSVESVGVEAMSTDGDSAIIGRSVGTALAGRFIGNVHIAGTLTKNAGSFRIDHPLDPRTNT